MFILDKIKEWKERREREAMYWRIADYYHLTEEVNTAMRYGLSFKDALIEWDIYDYSIPI